jgi:hypothetical protein
MTQLESAQENLLRAVQATNAAFKTAQAEAGRSARKWAVDQVAGERAALDRAVRAAFDAGVNKFRLHREGLGTTSRKTLDDSLARSAASGAMPIETVRP